MKRLTAALLLVGVLWGCDAPLTPTPPFEPPLGEEPVEEPILTLPPPLVSGTSFSFEWVGVTAFDAGVRVSEGDESFLQWASSTGFTLVRVVPASVNRTYRTPGEGLDQLGPLLDAAARYGLYVEVVLGVDLIPYGYHQRGFADFARAVAEITNKRTNVLIELANEIGHQTQPSFLAEIGFQRELARLFNAPVSAGSTHGGSNPKWDAGDYLTHHADRRLGARAAVSGVAAAQARFGKPVVFDEHIGVAEVARVGARVADPFYGAELGRACREYRVSCTLHLDAGLEAKMNQLGPIQEEAARLFIAGVR